MKILLDAVTFHRMTRDPSRLSASARSCCSDPENTLYLSSVSAAEIAIKHQLGKFPLPDSPDRYIPMQRSIHAVHSLPLDETSSLLLASLPLLHKDPFDRLLVCQALAHDLTILTPDRNIRRYDVATVW